MCGICGELRFEGAVSVERLAAMRDTLVHRGPDSDGIYVSPDRRAGLGFRRLAIIDLRPEAGQPMSNEDGTVWLVFNGEIYNFRPLRRELEARGHRFRSRADSEVIVHLYEDGGVEAIARLDGMFALALWDERARQLVLARDRVGKKPLFYSRAGSSFAFASEIKAFFPLGDHATEIAAESVPRFFIHGYVPGPDTLYRNVKQVEPGTTLVIDASGRVDRRVYWQLQLREQDPRDAAPGDVSEQDAAATVRALLTQAVERRLMSDVPLGAFLSGGIDSTIVVGLMSRLSNAPVRTFSIGFEGAPEFDETAYAREVAQRFRTDHTEFKVAPSAVDLVETLVWHHDGPFGDASAIPTYIISRLARQHVTVALNGDGGDELFAGYLRFAAALAAGRIPRGVRAPLRMLAERLPATASERHWLARARRFATRLSLSADARLTAWASLFFDDLETLLAPEFRASLPAIDRLGYLDGERDAMSRLTPLSALLHATFRSYLPDDLLVKADRCTMANGLEGRSPFLDTALVEYVGRLPDHFKLRGFTTKVILRRAFADLLPPSVASRGKMGFGVPLGQWFRGDLRAYVGDLLLDSSARYRAFLSPSYVHELVRRHQAGAANLGLQLWTLLTFELWLRSLPRWTRQPAAALA